MTPEDIVSGFDEFLPRGSKTTREVLFGHFLRDLLRDLAFLAARARANIFFITRRSCADILTMSRTIDGTMNSLQQNFRQRRSIGPK